MSNTVQMGKEESWELARFSTFPPPLFRPLLLYHFANFQPFELSVGSFININSLLHPFDGKDS